MLKIIITLFLIATVYAVSDEVTDAKDSSVADQSVADTELNVNTDDDNDDEDDDNDDDGVDDDDYDDDEDDVYNDEDHDDFDDYEDADGPDDEKEPNLMNVRQPRLNMEDQKSWHFAEKYRCDACQIVVHNVGTAFTNAESKISKKKAKKLEESSIIEIIDTICLKDKFAGYMVVEVSDGPMLTGPAFPERKVPGISMSMGGGMWPTRYVNYCGSVFENMEEEEEVYQYFRNGELFSKICLELEPRDCEGVFKSTPAILDFRPTGKHQTETREEL